MSTIAGPTHKTVKPSTLMENLREFKHRDLEHRDLMLMQENIGPEPSTSVDARPYSLKISFTTKPIATVIVLEVRIDFMY